MSDILSTSWGDSNIGKIHLIGHAGPEDGIEISLAKDGETPFWLIGLSTQSAKNLRDWLSYNINKMSY